MYANRLESSKTGGRDGGIRNRERNGSVSERILELGL